MYRRTLLGGAGALVLGGLVGCGSSSSGAESNAGGIATTIPLAAVLDLTGPVAHAGIGASRGAQLAIEEINSTAFLGDGVTIAYTEADSAGEIERASSEVTKAMANSDNMAILGPVQGQQAAAVAPLAERQKCPIWFTQAGADGVVISDYTFRATAPMHTYYDIAMEHLAEQGKKKVALLYNATYPTLAGIGEVTAPEAAQRLGIEITASVPVQSSTQDFAAVAGQLTEGQPDAIWLLVLNTQGVTAVTQITEAGYDGLFLGNTNMAGGNLLEAGDTGKGMLYPVDFSAGQEDENAAKFTEAFEAEYGELPKAYSAEAYDGMAGPRHQGRRRFLPRRNPARHGPGGRRRIHRSDGRHHLRGQ